MCQVWRPFTMKQYYDFGQSLSNISSYHWYKKRKSTLSILCELLFDLLLFIKLQVLYLTNSAYTANDRIRTRSYDKLFNILV